MKVEQFKEPLQKKKQKAEPSRKQTFALSAASRPAVANPQKLPNFRPPDLSTSRNCEFALREISGT